MEEQLEDKSKCILIPNKAVSVFHIGYSIYNYKNYNYEYIHRNEDVEYDMDSYRFINLPLTVWTDSKTNSKIATIKCDVSCIWQGKELIGMSYEDFLKFFLLMPDRHDQIYLGGPGVNGRNYDVYDFENLGLMIWVWRKKIREVLISNYEEDELF